MVNPTETLTDKSTGGSNEQPPDWEEQKKAMESILDALERQTSENQGYLKRILSLMTKEAEEMSTPTPSPPNEPMPTDKAAGKKVVQVTILDEK
ncbi:hypothetical protein GQ457_05G033250 [Hibiscus cannabinus]